MRRKFTLTIWLTILVAAFSVTAQEKPFDAGVLSEQGKEAYRSLVKIDAFAIGGTGYSGETSKGESSMDILLKEDEALPAFKSLLQEGSAEGQLYGLMGLKLIGCQCFKDELKTFRDLPATPERKTHGMKVEKNMVVTMSGCIVSTRPRMDLADDIDKETDPTIKWKLDRD